MPKHEIILAGMGGQGILSAGSLMVYAGMIEGKHVSWLPSYGPEARGGSAHCHIILSDEPIESPIIESADALIAMDGSSLVKFAGKVKSGGIIITDSSLINNGFSRSDVEEYGIPATKIASDVGYAVFANIILLGKLIGKTNLITVESFESALKKVLPEKKHNLIPEEIKALRTGMEY